MASQLELRTCGRAGCRWPAAASLSFRYDTRQVWLLDLAPEPHPSRYDLCPHHADSLTVPRGWERVDERDPQEAVREPAGRDLEVRARGDAEGEAGRGQPVRVGGGNRYAALAEELPRLAREYGTPPGVRPAEGAAGQRASEPGMDAPPRSAPTHPPAVVPSRELAPLPPGAPAAGPPRPQGSREPVGAPEPHGSAEPCEPAHGSEAGTAHRSGQQAGARGGAEHVHTDEPHRGQLAIPVDEVDHARPGEAIVVSIEVAGARRRGEPQR